MDFACHAMQVFLHSTSTANPYWGYYAGINLKTTQPLETEHTQVKATTEHHKATLHSPSECHTQSSTAKSVQINAPLVPCSIHEYHYTPGLSKTQDMAFYRLPQNVSKVMAVETLNTTCIHVPKSTPIEVGPNLCAVHMARAQSVNSAAPSMDSMQQYILAHDSDYVQCSACSLHAYCPLKQNHPNVPWCSPTIGGTATK